MTRPLFMHSGASVALRPYQLSAIEQLQAAVAAGSRAPLLVLPTGAGKTVIAAELIRRAVAKGGSVVFLAPRRELIEQTSRKLDDIAVEHGVLLAGADARAGLDAAVQVASVDTLLSRMVRREQLTLPVPTLVLVDEAHLSITLTRQKLLSRWPQTVRIGLTATPTRKDGRALGVLYDAIVEPATTATLTAGGYLVPARYWSWPTPDLRGVRVVAGDYNWRDLERVMNQPVLLGDVVQHWLAHAGDRRTVVFATSIAHAVALAEAFRQVGVAAEHVDAGTPKDVRATIFARFRRGETQVLTNCFLAAYGFDLPELSCIVLARPTRSLMMYLQMLGRGLRIAPGKTDCLVLDHAGGVHCHGFVIDSRAWTLDGTYALEPTPNGIRAERPPKECPVCHAVWKGPPICPACGLVLQPSGKMVPAAEGELVQVGGVDAPSAGDRRAFYRELRGYEAERAYREGWAAHQYHERYGVFPLRSWNAEPLATPSDATRRFILSRVIAYSRGAKKRQAKA